jgi:hypothetical protein
MKFLFILIIIFTPVHALTLEKAIFPFTVDEQVPESEDNKSFIEKSSKDLINDDYWNSPLTKLDYMLMQFKKSAEKTSSYLLSEEDTRGTVLDSYFEKQMYLKRFRSVFGTYKKPTIDNYVYFNEDKGKIIVSFNVSELGKSKKPMKEICSEMMELYLGGLYMPEQKLLGYSYHNNLLKELFRGGEYKDYNKYLEKIANNLVYVLSLTSINQKSMDKRDEEIFNMTCFKTSDQSDTEFRKWSYKAKE